MAKLIRRFSIVALFVSSSAAVAWNPWIDYSYCFENNPLIEAVLDLERGYDSGYMEGHVSYCIWTNFDDPNYGGANYFLGSETNTLPVPGKTLQLETTAEIDPFTDALELRMRAWDSDQDPIDGNSLFLNEILSGDVVQYGGSFNLKEPYKLVSYRVEIVRYIGGGAPEEIEEINVLALSGSGAGDDPFVIELQFDALDFVEGNHVAESIELIANFVPISEVGIDVRPGNPDNKVYPNKTGKLPVAILSSADFDATQVDPASLRFGSAEAGIVDAISVGNVDGQYGNDVTAKFRVEEAGIFCNDTEVMLTGATYAGDNFEGFDAIDATECESGGCHAY